MLERQPLPCGMPAVGTRRETRDTSDVRSTSLGQSSRRAAHGSPKRGPAQTPKGSACVPTLTGALEEQRREERTRVVVSDRFGRGHARHRRTRRHGRTTGRTRRLETPSGVLYRRQCRRCRHERHREHRAPVTTPASESSRVHADEESKPWTKETHRHPRESTCSAPTAARVRMRKCESAPQNSAGQVSPRNLVTMERPAPIRSVPSVRRS